MTHTLAFTGVRRSWQPHKDNHEHYHHQLFVSFTSIHFHDRILRQKFQSFACAMQKLTTPSHHTDIQSAMSTDDAINSRIKWKLSQVLLFQQQQENQSEGCYSIGSVALDWSVTFYKFAKVDLILIADSTIRWQAPVCIIFRGGITARSFYIWSFKTSRHWTIYNIVDYSWTFSNSIGIYSKMG